jgi:diacylglycerol kinase (ATP)
MHVIVNPRAGRGAVKRTWPVVRAVLEDAEIDHTVTLTAGAGDATEAARRALTDGRRYVVVVGGDGTIHEVVNGLMDADGPRDPDAILGLVPAGSGSDFARTFGISEDPQQAARALTTEGTWGKLDLGRVWFRDAEGREAVRWFCNVAEAGIGAQVVVTAAKLPRVLRGMAYRLAAFGAITRYRPQEATVSFVGARARGRPDEPAPMEHTGTVTMVVVANGQFFGGGLRVAPRAIPSDAMLDLLIGEGTKGDALRALRKMPSGSHVPDRTIREFLASAITVDGPGPLAIEADGEPLGTTPARFDVVPDLLTLKI